MPLPQQRLVRLGVSFPLDQRLVRQDLGAAVVCPSRSTFEIESRLAEHLTRLEHVYNKQGTSNRCKIEMVGSTDFVLTHNQEAQHQPEKKWTDCCWTLTSEKPTTSGRKALNI